MLVPSHFCDIQITKETNGIGVHIPLLLLNIYIQTWNILEVNQTGTRGLHGMKLPFQNILQIRILCAHFLKLPFSWK